MAVFRMSPKRALSVASLCTIGGAILVNAVFLQSEKHPAPFFARKIAPVSQQSPAVAAVRAPRSVSAPSQTAVQSGQWDVGRPALPPIRPVLPKIAEPAETQAKVVNIPREVKAPAPGPARDFIGSLLTGGLTDVPRPPAMVPGASAPSARDRDAIQAMQKALIKLGYKLDADGIAGPATRSALEQFQRANKIAATGKAEAKTLRLLALRARVTIPN